MRKSYVIALLLIFVFLTGIRAQEQSLTDIKGNIYEWNDHEIKKSDQAGKLLFTWQKPSGGSISWIDPADPFQILTYSAETNKIIWLNNKLSPIGDPFNLSELNIFDPLGLCASKDGGIWVLDGSSNMLFKLDKRNKALISVPVRIFESIDSDKWIQMLEWKQYLLFLDPAKQLWIADLFGQILKKTPVTATAMQASSEGLILLSGLQKTLYQPHTGQFKSLIKKP